MLRSPSTLLLSRLLLPLSAVAAFNNTCLLPTQLNPPTQGAPTTFLAECAAWVINTTDAVWRPDATAEQVNRSLEAYFYSDWTSLGSRGVRARGMAALKEQVWRTRRAFPDLAIHITDAFCAGNDVDGYKTAMPDVLTGTNRGPSGYGPATGRRVAYNGIAITYVQRVRGRWQYVSEWVVHDEWAILDQLGFDDLSAVPHPDTVATPHDCELNLPSWGWREPQEGRSETLSEGRAETPLEGRAETPSEAPAETPPLDSLLSRPLRLSLAEMPPSLVAELPSLVKLAGVALTALLLGTWIGYRVGASQRPLNGYDLKYPPDYMCYYQRYCS